MEWHQYLREERSRKTEALRRFAAGELTLSEARGGESVDTTDAAVERMRRNIAEIDEILAAAGVPPDEPVISTRQV